VNDQLYATAAVRPATDAGANVGALADPDGLKEVRWMVLYSAELIRSELLGCQSGEGGEGRPGM
jgi:hypothetical protein